MDASGDNLVCVHDDDLVAELAKYFTPTAPVRASHVEYVPGQGWVADLSPVGGPVLPARPRRDQAVANEVAWLEAHLAELVDVHSS